MSSCLTSEEPTLLQLFGESYETYLRAVPHWLPCFSQNA